MSTHRAHRRAPARRRRTLALLGFAVAGLGLGATAASADGGSLDLRVADNTGFASGTTADGAIVEYIGDLNTTYGSAGTGTFESFVRLQGSPQERGYNTDANGQGLEFETKAGKWTHSIKVSEIPVIVVDGQPYWELWADINDSNSDPEITLSELEVYFTDDPALTGYDFGADASRVYDFAGEILINDVNQGSGRGDLRYLVPVQDIAMPADCAYGQIAACDTYFVLYSDWSGSGEGSADSGFEEWKVKSYPYLTVTKTAEASYLRDFDWTIEKSSSVDEIDLFDGQTGSTTWTIDVTRSDPIDSDFEVEGTVTVANPSTKAASVTSVTDVLSDAGAVALDCGTTFPTTIPAGGSLVCTYATSLDAATDQTNTATATLVDGPVFSGSAAVDFGDPTAVTDAEIDVTDSNSDDAWSFDGTDSVSYQEDFTCGGDEGEHTNIATITQTGQSAEDSVTVNCHQLEVEKTAETSYTRTYAWDIEKARVVKDGEDDADGDPGTLTLDVGQAYDANYAVTVTNTGSTDSDAGISGTITVTNAAPITAEDVVVSDELEIGADTIAVDVDCDDATPGNQDTVDITAEDSVTCSYTQDRGADLTDGTNTATATLAGVEHTDDAAVDFGDPTTRVDECIEVTDDRTTPGDTADDVVLDAELCVDELDAEDERTYDFSTQIGPFAGCGPRTVTNTAAFEANDTGAGGSSSYPVAVDVVCAPDSCTLTQGYWKTHNDTFWGGAPTDDTWQLIGPAEEGTTFFLSGQTWFQVMWTGPAGNAYYQLARQYAAAELNRLNGADTTAVTTALTQAKALFEQYTPAQVAALKGKNGTALRSQFVALAGTLAAYNEGATGPGHCDEDLNSKP